MKTAQCLLLEATDFTPDGNLRKEAFEALSGCEIVMHEARVIKNTVTGAVTASNTPETPRRRRARQIQTPPQAQAPPEESTPFPAASTHTPHTLPEAEAEVPVED